jgi:hypothetical protein
MKTQSFLALIALAPVWVLGAPDSERKQIMAEAQALAKGNDLVTAEQAASELALSPENTPAWHIETAQQLVLLAGRAAKAGQPANVRALALRALDHLSTAQKQTGDSLVRASAAKMAGQIYERYLGDIKSAKASYRAALAAMPAHEGSKQALKRLEEGEKNQADRVKK